MTGPFGDPDDGVSDDEPAAARAIPLTDRDISNAARLLRLLTEASDAAFLQPVAPQQSPPDPVHLARRELIDRQLRLSYFPEAMFGEAAWDILLFLFVERHGRRFSIGRLAEALCLPSSSTVRWVNYLQDKRYVQRMAHPTDQRAILVEITESGADAVAAYYSAARSRTIDSA